MSFPRFAPLTPFEEVAEQIPRENFIEVRGQRVFVRDEGEGPALVLLHGLASSAHSFREIFPRMGDRYRLLAIDLNGFGNTERPRRKRAYHISYQAELIAEVLKAKGVDEATIVGHSYGAAVACVMALRFPKHVPCLILISPPSEFGERPPWYLRNGIGVEVAYFLIRALLSNPEKFRELSQRAVYVEGVLTDELSEIYRRSMLVQGFRRAFLGFASAFAAGEMEGIRYEVIEQPVVVIAGDKDEVVKPETVREVAERIPRGTIEWIEECGHCGPEECPDEVVRAIEVSPCLGN